MNRALPLLAVFLGVLLSTVAWAGNLTVTVAEGALRPGLPGRIYLTVLGDDGQPLAEPPSVSLDAGQVAYLGVGPHPHVHAYRITPAEDAGDVQLRVGDEVVGVDVDREPQGDLDLPDWISATATNKRPTVRFDVTAREGSLPPPEALQVRLAEGDVESIEAAGDKLRVTVRLGESRFPRVVPIAVRDARGDARPTWGAIRLRARPRLRLQAIDPFASVTIKVGSRTYGPFVADEAGNLEEAWFEQYPGESQATVTQTDDLGNVSTTPWPLAVQGQSALLAVPVGVQVPGQPPPAVYLRAVHGDGYSWTGRAPTCRSPVQGVLKLVSRGKGTWVMPLPWPRRGRELQDLRVDCNIGEAAATTFRVPVAESVPARLSLRVWPRELSTDFPLAEIQVALEDARGERLPVEGVQVLARSGEVFLEAGDNALLARGEYRGDRAVDAGEDVLYARYHAPAGSGVPGALQVGFDIVPVEGTLRMHGRAVDLEGRPLPGVSLQLRAGAAAVPAVTGPDGWATAEVPVPSGSQPLVVEARTEHRRASSVAVRGARGVGGPGTPDVRSEATVRILPGSTDRILVSAEPPTLYTARGAVALVKVRVLDPAGNPVSDDSLVVEVEEGEVSALQPAGAGVYTAEYQPQPGGEPRVISLTVRSDTGETGTGSLSLDTKPVDSAIGLSGGVQSNFGEVLGPVANLHLERRLLRSTFMLRVGLGAYFDQTTVQTGVGGDARLNINVVPIEVGLLLRRERRSTALWLGVDAAVAPYRQQVRFGSDLVADGWGTLYGLGLLAGGAARLGGDVEWMAEARWLQLNTPRNDISYSGATVGGLSIATGPRIVF